MKTRRMILAGTMLVLLSITGLSVADAARAYCQSAYTMCSTSCNAYYSGGGVIGELGRTGCHLGCSAGYLAWSLSGSV